MQTETEPLFAILAGGRATRLGGDQVSARLGGRPLISYPLEAAHAAVAEIVVVAKPDTALPAMEVPVLREPPEPVHPLLGIVTALEHGEGRPVIAIAADMPFLTGELLGWMERLEDTLAVPSHGGRLHPLLGRYGAELLEQLKSALKAEAALQETVASLGPRELTADDLAPFGDPERLLFNVNTPEDLARAAEMMG
jgi:molybdopterin-guanine dinucleotide biosynthesis protein A